MTQEQPGRQRKRKPKVWRRPWVIGLTALLLGAAFGSASAGGGTVATTTAAAPAPTVTVTAAAAPAQTVTVTTDPVPATPATVTAVATAVVTVTEPAAAPVPVPIPTAATSAPARTELPSSVAAAPVGDQDCPDFASQAEAQAYFESLGGPSVDPDDLDRDKDGLACERDESGGGSAPSLAPTRTGSGGGSASYANCTEARNAGVTPLRRGDRGYSRNLDRDGDGVACE